VSKDEFFNNFAWHFEQLLTKEKMLTHDDLVEWLPENGKVKTG